MADEPKPAETAEDAKSEINKLGTGQEIDEAKLWEIMEEGRMDRILETLCSIPDAPEPIGCQSTIVREIETRLSGTRATDAHFHAILDQVLKHFACTAGTIHSLGRPHPSPPGGESGVRETQSQMLHLRARRNIPDELLPRIQTIPIGKGMAGLAAQRRQPVQVCNLQTDESGAARPGAKETGMEGCIAVPILAGDLVVGVLGVAKPTAYDYSETEIALLMEIGRSIGKFLVNEE